MGWVYLIKNGDLYKIGITENIDQRMKQLKPDKIISTLETYDFEAIEKKLHKRYKMVRLPQTEYFRLTKSQLVDCKKILNAPTEQLKNIYKIIRNNIIFLVLLFIAILFSITLFNIITTQSFKINVFIEDLISAFAWITLLSWCFSLGSLFTNSGKYLSFLHQIKHRLINAFIFLIISITLTIIFLILDQIL